MREAVSALVLEQPERVIDDADAVDLLLTPRNVELAVEQLNQLTMWAPARMHTVLFLLSRCNADANMKLPLYSNPSVAAYVARSLRSFETAALTFVLPQLVQALRHDRVGAISELLYDLCQRSALLSHQLMWILNSECKSSAGDGHGSKAASTATSPGSDPTETTAFIDKAASDSKAAASAAAQVTARHGFQNLLKGEDTLPAAVVSLRDRILASFSGPSKRLFDVEYTFFDRVTDVSGILKRDVRDPNLRKSKIKEALKDIRIKAELDAAKQKWRDEDAVMHLKPGRASGDAPDQPFSYSNPLGKHGSEKPEAGGPGGPRAPGVANTLTPMLSPSGPSSGTAAAGGAGAEEAPAAAAAAAAAGGTVGVTIELPQLANVADTHHSGALVWCRAAAGVFTVSDALYCLSSAGSLAGVASLLGGKAHHDDAPPCVYMPTSPYYRVVSVDCDSGRPMQSAAKCPFLLTFNVAKFEGPDAALRMLVKLESRRKRVRGVFCVELC